MRLALGIILLMVVGSSCRSRETSNTKEVLSGTQKSKDSLNLVNGSLDSANMYKDSVFLLGHEDAKGIGTGFAAFRRKRCLVTAAHMVKFNPTMVAVSVDQSATPYNYNIRQVVARQQSRWNTDQDLFTQPRSTDIGILWLTNFQNPPTGPKKFIDTYVPFSISREPLAGLPTNLTVVGYGPDPVYQNTDSKNRRTYWDLRFDAYLNPFVEYGSSWNLDSSDVPKGSLYVSNDYATAWTTYGDSGGPAFVGNTVYGIVQGVHAYTILKKPVEYDYYYTGVEQYADGGTKKNNNEWLRKYADFVCTKSVSVYPRTGVAGINGSTIRTYYYPEIEANGKINFVPSSSNSDGFEFIHEGMTISLSATLEQGFSFVQWEGPIILGTDGTNKNLCPCNGSKNPVCTLSYDNIGIYDEVNSIDEAQCSVVTSQSGSNTGGTGGPSTGAGTEPSSSGSSSSSGGNSGGSDLGL